MRRGSAGRVRPDGSKPHAINWQPKFFDISFVTIPADPTASVMAKVAQVKETGVTSEENMDNLLKMSGLKKADIIKRIDGKIEATASDPKRLIPFLQEDAPKEEIKSLTDKYSLNELLSTLLSMQIMPKKKDFQRMVLYSSGKHDLADRLDSCGHEFPVDETVDPIMPADIGPSYMRSDLAQEIKHWIPERSLTKPLIIIRVMKKMASLEKIAEPDPGSYKSMSGSEIVDDLRTKHGMGADEVHPWMYKNNLWNADALSRYNSLLWNRPIEDPKSWDTAGSDYEKAEYARTLGETDADTFQAKLDSYGLSMTGETKKNMQYLAKPPAQNALMPYGLKGWEAKKQGRIKSHLIAKAEQQAQEQNQKGMPTGMEEEGKILPASARTGSLNKISEYLQKRASYPHVDPENATKMEERGLTPRIHDMNKKSPEKNPFFAITGLGALYLGYRRLLDMGASKNLPKLERAMIQNPWMLPLLAGGIGTASVLGQQVMNKTGAFTSVNPTAFEPGIIKSIIAAAVPSYFYSGAQEAKVRRGQQIDNFQDFVRKHPLLTTIGGYAAVRGGVKAINKYASAEDIVAQMDNKTINQLYTELIS